MFHVVVHYSNVEGIADVASNTIEIAKRDSEQRNLVNDMVKMVTEMKTTMEGTLGSRST